MASSCSYNIGTKAPLLSENDWKLESPSALETYRHQARVLEEHLAPADSP